MDRGIIESSPPRGSLVISSNVGSLSKRTVISVQRPTATTSDLCSFSVSGVISILGEETEKYYNQGEIELYFQKNFGNNYLTYTCDFVFQSSVTILNQLAIFNFQMEKYGTSGTNHLTVVATSNTDHPSLSWRRPFTIIKKS